MASAASPTAGGLDERLVDVALAVVAAEGPEGLTLRRVAREAGVSHGAPLRHFQGLADLRAEVAARGFRLLSEAIEASGAGLPPGSAPLARLAAAGRAYVDVAVAHPGLFALMFRPDSVDRDNAHYARESTDAFEHVVRHVRAAQDAGFLPDRETRALSGVVWAAVHGLATLWSQGALPVVAPGAGLDDLVKTTLQLVLQQEPGDPA